MNNERTTETFQRGSATVKIRSGNNLSAKVKRKLIEQEFESIKAKKQLDILNDTHSRPVTITTINDSSDADAIAPAIASELIETPGVLTPKRELKEKIEALKSAYRLLGEDSITKNKWQETCRLEQEYWGLRGKYFVLNRDTLWGSADSVVRCVSTTPTQSEWIGADGTVHLAACSLQQCLNDMTLDTLNGNLTGSYHHY